MKNLCYTWALCCAAIVLSCGPREHGDFETIDYVKQIVADSTAGPYQLIRALDPASAEGEIAILGEPEVAAYLAEQFLTSDRFNNITGRKGNDLLPDFAGERIGVILDEVHAPYTQPKDTFAMREAVVRMALSTVDTLSRLNSFNAEAVAPKWPVKVLVLSSSMYNAFGYADVDTLFKMAGRRIPIVTPVESMMAKAFENPTPIFNVGVWADESALDSGAYKKAFEKRSAAAKGSQCTLAAFCPDKQGDVGNRFLDYLNKYLHGGTSFPLSVLLLDDYGVDVALLEEQLAEIRRMESSEMVEYNKLLAPDFRFIDATGTITTEVYGILRGRNLFTHDIAYPRLDMFQTFPLGEDFVVIQSRREILEPETLDFIQENTTEVKKYYAVQGKH
ncbi:MAG: hypothetical protein IKX37_02460 [Bacteroidales bacterium]|nr:hypothetical protein [Bacteroidales bacterium]